MGKTVTELTAPKKAERLIRLAPYCRVSSDSEDQQHSFAAQVKYYTEYTSSHPEYALVDIYADEGVTGTRMDKRSDFSRLIRDCRKGKIDIKPRYLIQSRLQYSQRKCKNSGFRSSLSIRSCYFSFGGKLARRKQETYWIALEPPVSHLNPLQRQNQKV